MTDNPPFWARASLIVVILLVISFVAWAAVTQVEEIARGEGKVIPVSRTASPYSLTDALGQRRTGDRRKGRPDRQEGRSHRAAG